MIVEFNRPAPAETEAQLIVRLLARIEELEHQNNLLSWETNPDRSGGYTPPSEIRDGWDQWGR